MSDRETIMTAHTPPVPPANRSHKGPGSGTPAPSDTEEKHAHKHENLKEQGAGANLRQNTSNKGYQQNR